MMLKVKISKIKRPEVNECCDCAEEQLTSDPVVKEEHVASTDSINSDDGDRVLVR
jgi:hypothetical protein